MRQKAGATRQRSALAGRICMLPTFASGTSISKTRA
jgi:hypothetical protein